MGIWGKHPGGREIIALVLALGLVFTLTSPTLGKTSRLAGATRFETAKIIAEAFNNSQVENIILVTGHNFKDALAASVLAYQKNAPILLVDSTPTYSQDAFDYIKNHLAPTGTVYIIGGSGVIGQEFETALSTWK